MLEDKELEALKATKSEQEWNDLCDAIKENHGGYPADWFPKVLLIGLPYTLPWYGK